MINNLKNVALINCFGTSGEFARKGSPRVSLLSFIPILERYKKNSLFLDMNFEDISTNKLIKKLRKFYPDVIALSCFCENRFELIDLVKRLKSVFPNAFLMAGGHQLSHYSEDALHLIPELDLIVRGEGEISFEKLVESDFYEADFKNIKGICYRDGGAIIINEDEDVPDLNKMDFPAWNIIPKEKITDFSIITSRGCVGKCNFCATGARPLRYRDPELVLDEIEWMIKLFGKEKIDGHLNFFDDSLTLNRRHMTQIMNGMIERNWGIRWMSRGRADTFTEENIELMKAAGCIGLGTGIDAPNQKMINIIGKNEKIENILRGIRTAAKKGISVNAAILLGNIQETEEDMYEGVELYRMLESIPNVSSFLGVLKIYPGTALESIGRMNGSIPSDFSWYKKNDMKRSINPRYGLSSEVPYFQNGIVDFSTVREIAYSQGWLTKRKLRIIMKKIIKGKNWGIIFRAGSYKKLYFILKSFLKKRNL